MATLPKMSINSYEKRCLITSFRPPTSQQPFPRNGGRGIKTPLSITSGKVPQNGTGLNAILEGGLGSAWMIAHGGKAPIRSTREHGALPLSTRCGPSVERPWRVRNRCSRFRGDGGDDAAAGCRPFPQTPLRMFTDGCGKAGPAVIRIDRHEIQLQSEVVADVGAMAQNITPWATFNANALVVFVPARRHLVSAHPCANVRRIVSPLDARRPSGSSLDDVSP